MYLHYLMLFRLLLKKEGNVHVAVETRTMIQPVLLKLTIMVNVWCLNDLALLIMQKKEEEEEGEEEGKGEKVEGRRMIMNVVNE